MGFLLSPEEAAKRAGVSRRTILRVVERRELQAVRDNRNRWRVDGEVLDAWAGSRRLASRQRAGSVPGADETAEAEAERVAAVREVGELRAELAGRAAELAGVRELLRAVEADRDVWRDLARRSWWQRLFGGR